MGRGRAVSPRDCNPGGRPAKRDESNVLHFAVERRSRVGVRKRLYGIRPIIEIDAFSGVHEN